MSRVFDLKQKEVINVTDGCRFGYVADLDIDDECGSIEKLIIPGHARVFGIFGREQEYHVPWDCVKQIGEDIILVEVDTAKVTVDCE